MTTHIGPHNYSLLVATIGFDAILAAQLGQVQWTQQKAGSIHAPKSLTLSIAVTLHLCGMDPVHMTFVDVLTFMDIQDS